MPVQTELRNEMKVLITLERNTFTRAEDVIEAITQAGHDITAHAKKMIWKTKFGISNEGDRMAITTPAALDFTDGGLLKDVFKHAQEKFGLKLCSSEDIFQLRIKIHQQEGDTFWAAMERMALSHKSPTKGDERIFLLDRDMHGQSWLSDLDGDPEQHLFPDDKIIFRLPG